MLRLPGGGSWSVLRTGRLAGYALWVTFDRASEPTRKRRGAASPGSLLRSPRLIGAYLVHLGVIVTFVAVAISANYQSSGEATLRPGQSMEIGAYALTFDEAEAVREPHRIVRKATVSVAHDGRSVGRLEPSLNQYLTQREPLGTPAVRSTLGHDLYLTLMNLGGDGSIGLRAIVTPAVTWIWIGVFVMVAGTALCLVSPTAPRTT